MRSSPLRSCLVTAILLGTAAALRAQTALYVENHHEFCLVRAVAENDPLIDNGKGTLVRVQGRNYALRNVPEFAPVYVAVRKLKVSTQALQFVESGNTVNHEFDFRAEFESQYALDHVYAVLELDSDDAGKALFVQEVGRLTPRKPKPVHIAARLTKPLGRGRYQVHVYSEGTELFHSEMDMLRVERALDDMVRKRIAKVTDADPQPFTGPVPEYPEKLRKAHARGEAVIGFTISPTGRVLEPRLISATAPEFGESALTACRMWRFLPRVKAGKPMPMTVEMPFAFEPTE